jgi:hypothetical protein
MSQCEVVASRSVAAQGGDEERYGSQDRPEVSEFDKVSARGADATHLADPARSARGRVAAHRGTLAEGAGLTGQDAVGLAAAGISRGALGACAADAGTPGAAVERPARTGSGSILCPGA